MPISHAHKTIEASDYINPISFDNFKDVVTKKQDMYNEGRSLIQKQIDTYSQIADSLPKPEQRAYFEQEMEKLGKAINDNAGLDFSVKANTQAVLNIGKPLERDPIIINGIESAKNINKMKEEYAKLDASLKSPENDALFYKHINNWYTNGKIDEKLEYQPYKPYQKGVVDKWAKAMDAAKPNITTSEELDPKTGQWIVKTKISEVDQERVMKIYNSMLTSAEQEQLGITAMYQLDNIGKDAAFQSYKADIMSKYKGVESRLNELNSKYQEAAKKLGENDPDTLAYKREALEFSKIKDVLAKKALQTPETVSQSELVQHLISENLTDASGAYAYRQVETDLKENPYKLAEFKSVIDRQDYVFKKGVDLDYEKEKERLGLSSGTDKASRVPVGFQKASEIKEGNLSPIQDFKTLATTSVEANQNLYNGLMSLAGVKLSADGKSLEPATAQTKQGTVSTATMYDVLKVAEAENNLNQIDADQLSYFFKGAGATTKGDVLQKLKGVLIAINNAKKNNSEANIAYTVANAKGEPFIKTMPIDKFLNANAAEILPVINDLHFYSYEKYPK